MYVFRSKVWCQILCLSLSANAKKPQLWSHDNVNFPLELDITSEGLMSNLRSLDDIGKANGGNRAFGLPGFAASVDYVVSQTAKLENAKVWTQNFTEAFSQFKSIGLRVGSKDYKINFLQHSPSTSETGISASLILGPEGTEACSRDGYENLDVEKNIVLVGRRACPDGTTFAGLVHAAAEAGAAGVIIYNDSPFMGMGTLRGRTSANQKLIPAGLISQTDGKALADQLSDGTAQNALFQTTQINEPRISQNVFAETKTGDPANVIMLGAHLDSVQAGPGINDDGSGVTLLLEIFKSLQKYDFKNKIRFAWWGAEESGLLGSNFYTGHLAKTESDNILAYLNFDMIARGYFGIFDGSGARPGMGGPPGSEILHKLFLDAFINKGINSTVPEKFAGNSDYGSFIGRLNKPSGGLHTGSGYAQDPCYHRKCDTVDNINAQVLTTNAQITAQVISILAMEGEKRIPKSCRFFNRT
ncbi:leupeptin-inactivating enzyme 1 precursor [Microthyrium microscopicum]|uniref:Peptide hydrolase n=1 Tax=Microthyrium microscopicum TaxID=703497 RepID=A0A6A6UWR4_9PEZI|nr:leupeptin-inactivating enzyme 1 precursor [Microthyrium microscopicum]